MEKPKTNFRLCGLDEAGRGALAGPLVAAAIILPCTIKKLSRRAGFKAYDGKLLTSKQRNKVYSVLKRLKGEIAVEVVSVRSINNHGIGWANREIMRRLIKKVEADKYIVDGKLKLGRIAGKAGKVKSVVDADATVAEAICAGIVAKVERDKLMRQLHRQFPKYRWSNNAGYGTKEHLKAIEAYSLTYYHRNIFVATALRRRTM